VLNKTETLSQLTKFKVLKFLKTNRKVNGGSFLSSRGWAYERKIVCGDPKKFLFLKLLGNWCCCCCGGPSCLYMLLEFGQYKDWGMYMVRLSLRQNEKNGEQRKGMETWKIYSKDCVKHDSEWTVRMVFHCGLLSFDSVITSFIFQVIHSSSADSGWWGYSYDHPSLDTKPHW